MEASQIAKLPTPELRQILLYLYGYQTVEEQAAEGTIELNSTGFNRIDAEMLSSFAEQVKKGADLSDKQYNQMRLRLPKYHSQLDGDGWKRIALPPIIRTNGARSVSKDYSQLKLILDKERIVGPVKPVVNPNDKYTGMLELDPENNGLMFTPNVFPSKQIKPLGFPTWRDGKWHQYVPKVHQSIVDDVKTMFGEIYVDPRVLEALAPKPLPSLPEWMNDYPLIDFQKEAIQMTVASNRLLLALAPRLGKTVVCILAANMLQCKRILVVAPLSLLRDWRSKIRQWCVPTKGQPFDADVAIWYNKNLPIPARWTITNYDTLRRKPEQFNEPWDLIIIDESLLVKNRKSQRSEIVFELVNGRHSTSKRQRLQRSLGTGTEIAKPVLARPVYPKYVWLLSGAPTSRLYDDLWMQLNILDARRFSSYWKFTDKYCVVQSDEWTQYRLVANKPDAVHMLQKDLADVFYMRSHEDVLNLPPMVPENLEVDMSSYQDKMYGKMVDDFTAELLDESKLVAGNVLAQIIRLVQIASNPLLIGGKDDSNKWKALLEMLQFEIKPIIVWTSFVETVKMLQERIKPLDMTVATLTGATPALDRQPIVENFQSNNLDVLIAHPAVGKYGLDLWNAKSVIYLERGYNADDYYQSLNRVRHVQQTSSAAHIVHLLSERKDGGETIDHIIDTLLRSRTDATKKLTSANLRKMLMGEKVQNDQ